MGKLPFSQDTLFPKRVNFLFIAEQKKVKTVLTSGIFLG